MPIRRLTGYPAPAQSTIKIVVTNEQNEEGDLDVDTSDTAYDSEEESDAESEILRRRREISRREALGSHPVVMSAVEVVDDEKVENNKLSDVKPNEKEAAKGNTFPPTPVLLKDGGVAVTEEAIEEGVPDVVVC